ncbi:hypothetical protein IAR55_001619 [Kwoniella newhampshirensis]|uniref:SET domain-containing protein n=1 Tax=Kwoniella newhampshirensis TaxID=1651941 RepID=A0AAW0Z2P0_9TREE
MAPGRFNDTPPPSHWPSEIIYLTKPRLSARFPPSLTPLLLPSSSTTVTTFAPRPFKHPSHLTIKRVVDKSHPAFGQFGLFANKKIKDDELVIPYLGVLHVTLAPVDDDDATSTVATEEDEHSSSDYDISLLRMSASDPRNPFGADGEKGGRHISIGVDAAQMGNAARFINDYRGVRPSGPNSEFRMGRGEGGEARMEIWTLKGKGGVGKGEEILVSYGKAWWGARKG